MKRKILSFFLILAVLLSSLLTVSCGTLNVDRPQAEQKQEQVQTEQKQEQTQPEQKQEQIPEQKQEEKAPEKEEEKTPEKEEPAIDENGIYTSKEDVALYLWTYKKLPSNFMTKSSAEKLGWSGGGLDKYQKNACIGGDNFGNREGLLPKNHKYKECDIDTMGAKSRGAKRLVFASDYSLIYYTEDHYSSFELLYGTE